MKSAIFKLRTLLSTVKKVIFLYSKEALFFLRAKFSYIKQDITDQDNKPLLIRKRTHHLERFLFEPHAYPKDTGKKMAFDIERLLENLDEDLPAEQKAWSLKILNEYNSPTDKKCSTFCSMLNKNIKRSTSHISSDDMLRLLQMRRSRRIFSDTPLTDDEKAKICSAAQYAPSSCNRQSLELIFVEDSALKKTVSQSVTGGRQFFHKAPCIIVIISDIRDYRYPEDRVVPYMDAASAVENIYLMCETMGLGCCWGSYSSFGSVCYEERIRRALKIPSEFLIVSALAVGKSDQCVCPIPRDPPEKRFAINTFRKDF